MKVLLNNKIKDTKKFDLDTGYYYGYGAFETILIREGQPILLVEHIDRLNKALVTLGINKSISVEEAEYAITVLRLYNTALKINVSENNILYSSRGLTYTADHYKAGASLKMSDVFRNPTSPSVYMKTMNYMDNIMEIQKARREGYNDVLFMNYDKLICETAVANIFLIKNGQIKTPAVKCGLLDGVVRQWLCKTYEVVEDDLCREDFMAADGVFITNSLMGIMKVAAIDGVSLKQDAIVAEITKSYVALLKESGDLNE